MKHYLLYILFAASTIVQAQEANPYKFTSLTDLYDFPTVGATGNLDAQLPLYTISTRGFEVPVTLTYDQMGNTNVFYKGSQFGDAWVLNAVGTISRSCRERPSPIYSTGKSSVNCGGSPFGQYDYEAYRYKSLTNDEYFYTLNPTATTRQLPDIYTFSFLNLSGKFVIEKNGGQYVARIIESNDLVKIQISNTMTPDFNNFSSILITDKNGYQYKFASPSNINQNQTSNVTYAKSDVTVANGCDLSGMAGETPYPGLVMSGGTGGSTTVKAGSVVSTMMVNGESKFWENLELTEIYDKENNLLLSYEYETVFVSVIDAANRWVNGIGMFNSYHKLYLKKINIAGQGSIVFNNVISNNNKGNVVNSYTSSIEVKDLKQNNVKKYEFNYMNILSPALAYIAKNYDSQGEMYFEKRLLSTVKELDTPGQKSSATAIEYKAGSISNTTRLVDRYGFLVDTDYCRTHLHGGSYKANEYALQRITYPTGGSVVYKFGPNTFTKIPAFPGGFTERNYDNHRFVEIGSVLSGSARKFTVTPGETLAIICKSPSNLKIYKNSVSLANLIATVARKNVGTSVYFNETHCKHHATKMVVPADAGTSVYITLESGTITTNDLKVYRYSMAPVTSNFAYAEGSRIEKIAYFKDSVSKTVLESGTGEDSAEKVVTFRYEDEAQENASSGKVRGSFFTDWQMRPLSVVYENVNTEIRGVGNQKTYYDLGTSTNWGAGLRTDVSRNLVYGLNRELLSESTYSYTYQSNDLTGTSIQGNEVKPFITSTTTSSKNYEGSAFQNSSSLSLIDAANRQLTSSTTTDALGKVVKTEYDYAQKGNALVNTDTRSYVNATMKEQVRTTYDAVGNLMKTEFKTPDMSAYEKTGQENTRYIGGLLAGYTQADGTPVTLVYGYNNTQIVAKMVNVNAASYYDDAAYQTLRNTIAQQSNQNLTTYNEASLKTTLNSLRATFTGAQITSYTYQPLVGVSSITDANSKTNTYEYDSFSRLATVKDYLGNILKEYQYNFTN